MPALSKNWDDSFLHSPESSQVNVKMHMKEAFENGSRWYQVTVINVASEENSIDCERLIYFLLRGNLLTATSAEREGWFLDTAGAGCRAHRWGAPHESSVLSEGDHR